MEQLTYIDGVRRKEYVASSIKITLIVVSTFFAPSTIGQHFETKLLNPVNKVDYSSLNDSFKTVNNGDNKKTVITIEEIMSLNSVQRNIEVDTFGIRLTKLSSPEMVISYTDNFTMSYNKIEDTIVMEGVKSMVGIGNLEKKIISTYKVAIFGLAAVSIISLASIFGLNFIPKPLDNVLFITTAAGATGFLIDSLKREKYIGR